MLFQIPSAPGDAPFRIVDPLDPLLGLENLVPSPTPLSDVEIVIEADDAKTKYESLAEETHVEISRSGRKKELYEQGTRVGVAVDEANQICAELGRTNIIFTLKFISLVEGFGVLVKDVTSVSKVKVTLTHRQFDEAMSMIRDGFKNVELHIEMGDDYELPLNQDPSVAFFDHAIKVCVRERDAGCGGVVSAQFSHTSSYTLLLLPLFALCLSPLPLHFFFPPSHPSSFPACLIRLLTGLHAGSTSSTGSQCHKKRQCRRSRYSSAHLVWVNQVAALSNIDGSIPIHWTRWKRAVQRKM